MAYGVGRVDGVYMGHVFQCYCCVLMKRLVMHGDD